MKQIRENENSDEYYAFEEYQIFYESTEKVTDRRLTTNRWNYSICTAILVVDAVLFSWAVSNPRFLIAAAVGIVILSMMAILFCSLWIGQITDFKMLNNAKFEVLNNMAPLVRFGESHSDDRVSFTPWAKEWEVLKEKRAIQEMASINIVALNSSNIEYIIPRAFRFLFILVAIVAVIISIRNWDLVIANNAFMVPVPTPTTTPMP